MIKKTGSRDVVSETRKSMEDVVAGLGFFRRFQIALFLSRLIYGSGVVCLNKRAVIDVRYRNKDQIVYIINEVTNFNIGTIALRFQSGISLKRFSRILSRNLHQYAQRIVAGQRVSFREALFDLTRASRMEIQRTGIKFH